MLFRVGQLLVVVVVVVVLLLLLLLLLRGHAGVACAVVRARGRGGGGRAASGIDGARGEDALLQLLQESLPLGPKTLQGCRGRGE